jgi:hypothetical protein
MPGRFHLPWLPRLLCRLTVAASAILFLLVLLAPLVDNGEAQPDGWRRVVCLFARDAALRRTAVASAVGLLVTAGVFFRPSDAPRPLVRKRKHPGPRPPASDVAGA